MKYIRTKDGIYDTKKGLYTPSIKMFAIGTKTIYNDDIINQADTIEELGDWYVGIDTFGKAHFIEATIPFENVKLCFRGMEINMAILTSKGLVYVAKMNDEGDLELL